MPAYTLAEAQTELTRWKAALVKVSGGQSYTIAGRQLTYASIPHIREMINEFERLVAERTAEAGGSKKASVVLPKWNY